MQAKDVYEFMSRCDQHTDLEALFADFADVISKRGFHSFIYTGLPAVGHDVEPYVIKNAWPAGWTEQFREREYFVDDPVSRWSLMRSKPFLWNEARKHSNTSTRTSEIEHEAKRFGLCDGIVFPLFDPSSWQSVISIATDAETDLAKQSLGDLYLLSSVCASTAGDLHRQAELERNPMSNRDKEIIQWVSRGKTDWEIGRILQMTEGSVTQRLAKIRERLCVYNKAHAVSRAIRLGLINAD